MPKNKQDWQKDSPNLAIVCLCLEFSPDCAGCGFRYAMKHIQEPIKYRLEQEVKKYRRAQWMDDGTFVANIMAKINHLLEV